MTMRESFALEDGSQEDFEVEFDSEIQAGPLCVGSLSQYRRKVVETSTGKRHAFKYGSMREMLGLKAGVTMRDLVDGGR